MWVVLAANRGLLAVLMRPPGGEALPGGPARHPVGLFGAPLLLWLGNSNHVQPEAKGNRTDWAVGFGCVEGKGHEEGGVEMHGSTRGLSSPNDF